MMTIFGRDLLAYRLVTLEVVNVRLSLALLFRSRLVLSQTLSNNNANIQASHVLCTVQMA